MHFENWNDRGFKPWLSEIWISLGSFTPSTFN